MRSIRLFAAAAGAVVAASASGASAGDYGDKLIFGSVSSYSLGNRDVKSTDGTQGGSGQTFEFNSTSAYNIPIWKSVSMQIDSFSEYYLNRNSDSDPTHSNALGLHLSYRNPNQGLIGVFGGYSWTKVKPGNGGTIGTGGTDFDMAMFGAEAQLYVGNWTFYVQGGVANTSDNDNEREGVRDGRFARGVVRYFFTPNTKLEAEISYARANPYIDGGPGGAADDKGKFSAWGVSLDHKLFNVLDYPVYGTLAYRSARYEATQDPDHATEHVFKVGVKVMFGAKDLLQNDRNGATLDLPTLPIRANGLSQNLD